MNIMTPDGHNANTLHTWMNLTWHKTRWSVFMGFMSKQNITLTCQDDNWKMSYMIINQIGIKMFWLRDFHLSFFYQFSKKRCEFLLSSYQVATFLLWVFLNEIYCTFILLHHHSNLQVYYGEREQCVWP